MLFGKKKEKHLDYDHEKYVPVIRKSICTAEMTAGFRNRETGKFEDVMLIRDGEDLKEFKRLYGIAEDPEIFY